MKIEDITYSLPDKKVTNTDLTKENPSWELSIIEKRAGVSERPCALENETAFDFAYRACVEMFEKNEGLKSKVDAVIVCTQTPDYIMPGNSFLLHEKLGLKTKVICFDFNLACSGFVYGLAISQGLLVSKQASNILLVTGDTYSKYINPRDRSTRTLFGDGVAVTWLSNDNDEELNILSETFGKGSKQFYIPDGGCRTPISESSSIEKQDSSGNFKSSKDIHMNGFGVLSFINSKIPSHLEKLFENASLSLEDVDLVIFHQASKMTLDSLEKLMKIPQEKMFSNLYTKGNLVSASIPVAIKDAIDCGKLKRGDRLLLSSFGVGLSYSSVVLRF